MESRDWSSDVCSSDLGYKANMNTYLMACVSLLSDKGLDLTYIWENQMVQQDVYKRQVSSLTPKKTKTSSQKSFFARCWLIRFVKSVSYTHLDVYKRQVLLSA